ncbi:MAG TPA: hypothetical protein VKB88_41430 [Bryobacteraceae bacterium]|nr:hypothetical protein [Bryobacteraceae bacterium]
MAGDREGAERIAAACLGTFFIGPDLRPRTDDDWYFMKAGLRRPPKPPK